MSAYDELPQVPANYQPLTPLTFLERAASVFELALAGGVRLSAAEKAVAIAVRLKFQDDSLEKRYRCNGLGKRPLQLRCNQRRKFFAEPQICSPFSIISTVAAGCTAAMHAFVAIV